MRRTTLINTTAATAFCSIAAHTAFADVTAADVRAASDAVIAATGGSSTYDVRQSGAVTTYENNVITYSFPFGFGSVSIEMPPYTASEQADGTVLIDYPDAYDIILSGNLNGLGAGTATLATTTIGDSIVASGSAGEVTFTTLADSTNLTLTSYSITSADVANVEIDLSASITDMSNTTTISVGDMIEIDGTTAFGGIETVFQFTTPDGATAEQRTEALAQTSASSMALVPGGIDIMNMAAALANGMRFEAATTTQGSASSSVVTSGLGTIIQQQLQTTGPGNSTLSFSRDGLDLQAEGADLVVEMIQEFLPEPTKFDVATMSLGLALPVMADEAAQDFQFAMDLGALRMGPGIWNLFDPNKELDRSPSDLRFDIAGTGVLSADLLNFAQIIPMLEFGQSPVEVQSVELRDLNVAALGAVATATAAFELDNTDLFTYPGFPKPVGGLSFTLDGLNTALDQLVAIGALAQDDVFGMRMMTGMVAQSTGEDSLAGIIELDENGGITANGQRLR